MSGRRAPTATVETVKQEGGVERLKAHWLSKLLVLAPPWVIIILLQIVGAVSHKVWGKPPAVTWISVGCTLGATVLTLMTWAFAHSRSMLGRWLATLTTAGSGLWFVIATIVGVTNPVAAGLAFVGGLTLGAGWNIRAVIRSTPGDGGGTDPLADLFDRIRGKTKTKATARIIASTDHKIQGKLGLDGQVVEDVQKDVKYIEAAAGFPPGSMIVSEDADRADWANITITDPRIIKNTIPWPGPSMPAGASVQDAMRLGLYQDMDEVLYTAIEHHLKLMGMSGSGKSFGAAWTIIAELITRYDVAIWAADITKADQTLGALEGALDWVVYNRSGAMAMIKAVQNVIEPRTQYLAKKRLKGWQKGCGLQFLVVWLEEAADIFDAMSDKQKEEFVSTMRAARSAGIYIVISMQRFDHTQIPTIIRGQMSGGMCFGVERSADAEFCLPDHVTDAGASPEKWQANRPGMCYLGAPGIPEAKHAVPIRTYWIEDHIMRAHVADNPATARPLDDVTAKAAGKTYADRPRTKVGSSLYQQLTGNDPWEGCPEVLAPEEAEELIESAGQAVREHAAAQPVDSVPTARTQSAHDTDDAGDDEFVELVAQAAEIVVVAQHASTQMVQRKLRLGYADSQKVMASLQRHRIVDADGSVLVAPDQVDEAAAMVREVGDPVAEYVTTPNPDPTVTPGPDDPIQEPTDGENQLRTPPRANGDKLSPDAARGLVEDWIRHRHEIGELSFTASDQELIIIRNRAGYSSRTWAYGVLKRIAETGALEIDESGSSTVFRIVDVDALGAVHA